MSPLSCYEYKGFSIRVVSNRHSVVVVVVFLLTASQDKTLSFKAHHL